MELRPAHELASDFINRAHKVVDHGYRNEFMAAFGEKWKQEWEVRRLYKEMSDLTAPFCVTKCANKFSCCATIHCENAAKFAKERYGIELKRTDHPTLPFMGPTGCTVAPHLRPVCTLHTCPMSQHGFHPYDSKFSNKYFSLRKQIEALEKSCQQHA